MAKAKKKPATKKPARKKSAAAKKGPARKPPPARKQPPAKKQRPAKQQAPARKQPPTIEEVRSPDEQREAIHVELGSKLTSVRGDEPQERAAVASAIDQFMQVAIASGAPPETSPYDAMCPEFFWEGDGKNPPVYARVPEATHDEVGRWFQFLVEEVRAYLRR